MFLPGFINVAKGFIVGTYRSFLIIAARKKLDHLPPIFFVFCFKEHSSCAIQCLDHVRHAIKICFHIFVCNRKRFIEQMLGREILQRKLLRRNLVHSTTRILLNSYAICIKFFPINGLSFTIVYMIASNKNFSVISIPILTHRK